MGNTNERPIQELMDLVIDIMDGDSSISYEPLLPQNPELRRPNISKVTEEVSMEPSIDPCDGPAQSVPYFLEWV